MLDLTIPNRYKKSVSVRKASSSYSDEFLTDISLSDQPSSGGWVVIGGLQGYPLTRPSTFCNTPAVSPEAFVCIPIAWPDKKDPFTQEDLLEREEAKVQEVIYQIKTSLSFSYRESLANRLITLLKDAKEEDPYSLGISYGSLQNFYNFFQLHDNLKRPAISLTPEYNIYASWRDNKKHVFSVHFLPSGDVRFVIFKPNDRHPERMIRLSGTATTDILLETVATYEIIDWISQ